MHYKPAELDPKDLEAIQNLEAELGKTIVALDNRLQYARMTPEQMQKLRKAEQKLGVVLVAYEN